MGHTDLELSGITDEDRCWALIATQDWPGIEPTDSFLFNPSHMEPWTQAVSPTGPDVTRPGVLSLGPDPDPEESPVCSTETLSEPQQEVEEPMCQRRGPSRKAKRLDFIGENKGSEHPTSDQYAPATLSGPVLGNGASGGADGGTQRPEQPSVSNRVQYNGNAKDEEFGDKERECAMRRRKTVDGSTTKKEKKSNKHWKDHIW
ncbi:hypothetical protein B0H14DRAFT_3137378 [Mycena olivaceomarginata]|nr:hypothetical protein B0H14DRAFT_3137378 [Mycena olivaceomarginata]